MQVLCEIVQEYACDYFGLSWNIKDQSIILTRLNKLIKSHEHNFIGTQRLIISAILLMLFKHDCIHRKIEGNTDISNSKISKIFIITILIFERQLLYSKYLNYITFPINIFGRMFYDMYTNDKTINIKNCFIKWKEEERNKNNIPVILDSWKIEIKPIMFFKLMSHRTRPTHDTTTEHEIQKQQIIKKYNFVDLPNEIIHIISTYSVGCIPGIKFFLS